MEENLIENSNPFQQEEVAETGFMKDTPEPSDIEVESQETVEPEEDTPKPKKKVSGLKTELNKIQRERYKALHLAEVAAKENEDLKKQLDHYKKLNEQSSNAALTHYDESISLRMEQAEHLLAKAIEEGDYKLQAKATAELARAQAQAENINSWKAQQKLAEQEMEQQQRYRQQELTVNPQENVNPTMYLNEDTENWLTNNPWFIQDSPDFDPDAAHQVQAFAQALEMKMRRSGQASKVLTKEYFDKINDYVSREIYPEDEAEEESYHRTLNMKPTRNMVSPVGQNSSAPKPIQKQRVSLTKAEKEFAAIMGMPEERYAQRKLEVQQSYRESGRYV